VTHACFEPGLLVQQYPRGGKALRGAFSRFQPQDTIQWFQDRGIALKTEADGRMFPVSDDSETIVAALVQAAHQAGVTVQTRAPVVQVQRGNQFTVGLKTGEVWHSDRLLLATGSNGLGHRIAQAQGHEIIAPVPSLFTFQIAEPELHQLAGISLPQVQLRLSTGKAKLEQTGSVLITHWGFSGPAVLKLSAWGARILHAAHYQAQLQINWLPDQNREALQQVLAAGRDQFPRRQVANYRPVLLPQRLWQYLVHRAEIGLETTWAELSNRRIHCLVQELTQGQYGLRGKGVFKEEFVTCGGVNLKQVNFKTMESRLCPGLHLAGELLDIDGVTGGFNFQSAWTTGWLAGRAIGLGL
jgi:predicted Rossmann fold flavoprotein